MLFVFWFAFALIAYTIIGFPILLIIRGILFKQHHTSDITFRPSVSLIVAAYNEEANIEAKMKNILELAYPTQKLQVLIASDGSTDATNEIVTRYVNDYITLLALPRLGKAKALERAVSAATGDILVFSDANSLYTTDAIQQLVKHFADDQIGGVAGNQRYIKDAKQVTNLGETGYWSIDRQLKIWESRSGNAISATGAIYAIRKSLFRGVEEGVTDDFYISTNIIAQHYRLLFEPDAIAYETVAKNQSKEFKRKVRIMTRGLTGILVMRELLNPAQHGFYAIQLFTHKVLRRILFLPLCFLFVANLFLIQLHPFYLVTLLPQLMVYGVALIGWIMLRQNKSLPRLISVPTYAVMVYIAAAIATRNIITGKRITRWSTHRSDT